MVAAAGFLARPLAYDEDRVDLLAVGQVLTKSFDVVSCVCSIEPATLEPVSDGIACMPMESPPLRGRT